MNKYPIKGEDFKGYGWKFGDKNPNGGYPLFHLGLDLVPKKSNTNGYAVTVLNILKVYTGTEGGKTFLAHDIKNHLILRFMHWNSISVKVGQITSPETVLGVVGHTGKLGGGVDHIHVDITKDDVPISVIVAGKMPHDKLIDPIKYFDNLSNNEDDMIKDERFWLTTDRESNNVGKYRVIGINNEKALWCAVSDDYLYSAYVQDDHKVGGKHLDEKIIAGKKKAPFRDVIFIK